MISKLFHGSKKRSVSKTKKCNLSKSKTKKSIVSKSKKNRSKRKLGKGGKTKRRTMKRTNIKRKSQKGGSSVGLNVNDKLGRGTYSVAYNSKTDCSGVHHK